MFSRLRFKAQSSGVECFCDLRNQPAIPSRHSLTIFSEVETVQLFCTNRCVLLNLHMFLLSSLPSLATECQTACSLPPVCMWRLWALQLPMRRNGLGRPTITMNISTRLITIACYTFSPHQAEPIAAILLAMAPQLTS